MKKNIIFFCYLFLLIPLLFACTKKNESFNINQYQNFYYQNVGSNYKSEMSVDDINEFKLLISNANYEYVNDDNINGWTYIVYCDDLKLLFGKYLTVVNNNNSKNYYSNNNSMVIDFLNKL